MNGFGVFRGDAGEPGFDAGYAEIVELVGDFEFLLRRENDADSLFAVAQRGVVEMDFGLREGGADFWPAV